MFATQFGVNILFLCVKIHTAGSGEDLAYRIDLTATGS